MEECLIGGEFFELSSIIAGGKLLLHLFGLAFDQIAFALQPLELRRLSLQLALLLDLLVLISLKLLFFGNEFLFEFSDSLEVAASFLAVEEWLSADSPDGGLYSSLFILQVLDLVLQLVELRYLDVEPHVLLSEDLVLVLLVVDLLVELLHVGLGRVEYLLPLEKVEVDLLQFVRQLPYLSLSLPYLPLHVVLGQHLGVMGSMGGVHQLVSFGF